MHRAENRRFVDPDATEEARIFLEDSFSKEVAGRIALNGHSPAAKAFLSPQRLGDAEGVEADDDDDVPCVVPTSGRRLQVPEFPFGAPPATTRPPLGRSVTVTVNQPPAAAPQVVPVPQGAPPAPAAFRGRVSFSRNVLGELTNHGTGQVAGDKDVGGKVPVPATRQATANLPPAPSYPPATAAASGFSSSAQRPLLNGSAAADSRDPATPQLRQCLTAPSLLPAAPSASSAPQPSSVPLYELARVEKERDRYRKMFEHQKQLAETALEKQQVAHEKLQEKIAECIALSSRLEESKRFIKQIKKEIASYRQRDLPYHNKALEDAKVEIAAQAKYTNILHQQQLQFEDLLERKQLRLDSLEQLLSHVTVLAGMEEAQAIQFLTSGIVPSTGCAALAAPNADGTAASPAPSPIPPAIRWDLSKLDSLLNDAYYECTSLVNDNRKLRRELEREVGRRFDVEKELDSLRKAARDAEIGLSNERRRLLLADESRAENHARLQTEVLELRQALLRAQSQGYQQGRRFGSSSDRSDRSSSQIRPSDPARSTTLLGIHEDPELAVPAESRRLDLTSH